MKIQSQIKKSTDKISDLLVTGMGVNDAHFVGKEVSNSQTLLNFILSTALKGNSTESIKAAWSLAKVSKTKQNLFNHVQLNAILECLQNKETTNSKRRELLKILLYSSNIKKKHLNKLFELTSNYVFENQTSKAVRYYSLLTWLKVAEEIPELKNACITQLEFATDFLDGNMKKTCFGYLIKLKGGI
jgi:hypothetical protein